jgi:hypothetical protein
MRLTDELHEATALVRALSQVKPQNDGDDRFISTRRDYLDGAGDRA